MRRSLTALEHNPIAPSHAQACEPSTTQHHTTTLLADDIQPFLDITRTVTVDIAEPFLEVIVSTVECSRRVTFHIEKLSLSNLT
jgi:hypothetical protein